MQEAALESQCLLHDLAAARQAWFPGRAGSGADSASPRLLAYCMKYATCIFFNDRGVVAFGLVGGSLPSHTKAVG